MLQSPTKREDILRTMAELHLQSSILKQIKINFSRSSLTFPHCSSRHECLSTWSHSAASSCERSTCQTYPGTRPPPPPGRAPWWSSCAPWSWPSYPTLSWNKRIHEDHCSSWSHPPRLKWHGHAVGLAAHGVGVAEVPAVVKAALLLSTEVAILTGAGN